MTATNQPPTPKPETKRPEVGPVFDVRFHNDVLVGTKQLTPNNPAIGSDGWECVVDLTGVWVTHKNQPGFWTRVPMENVRYIRFCRADGRKPGEPDPTIKAGE